MSEPLAVYLHDHLAGSAFVVDLLQSLRDHYAGDPLGDFAAGLLIEIKQDREALQQIADRIGKASPNVQEAAGWLAEKVARFKLSHDDAKGLGTFEALETVAIGILGKLALWRALMVISDADDRLAGVDLDKLAAPSEEQHARAEKERLLTARSALPASK
jgi:hypothetical protein